MNEPSERRLVENEVIFRDVNKNIQEFVDEEANHVTGETILPFYCECSSPTCLERIKLTTGDYAAIHKNRQHFITIVGHEFPQIEKVIKKTSSYQVVEKFITPPKPEEIKMALKSITE